jgi:glycosidase
MAEAMSYWVREADIDGYRCDVAGFVPTDFWEQVRRELDAIKPVFMLAEWEARDLHTRAFDMTYAWSWNEAMHHIAVGKADVEALRVYYAWNDKAYPRDSIRMLFVSNHDKNAWEGTEYEQFGDRSPGRVEFGESPGLRGRFWDHAASERCHPRRAAGGFRPRGLGSASRAAGVAVWRFGTAIG